MAWIRSNKKSGDIPIPTLATHSGKINMITGEIVTDNNYLYTDYFDCPDGYAYFGVGESDTSNTYIGVEMCLEDGTHFDYWSADGTWRNINCAQYYRNNNVRKLRMSFRKEKQGRVVFVDVAGTDNWRTYAVNSLPIHVD